MDGLFGSWGSAGYFLALNAFGLFAIGATVLKRRHQCAPGDDGESASGFDERIQAVRGSLAGVAVAVEALTAPEVSSGSVALRPRIELVLRHEVGRLQRLVDLKGSDVAAETIEELRLDDLVETAVLARSLTRQPVIWHRNGLSVMGRHCELLEVLDILLVNAGHDAVGSPVAVRVASHAGLVRVTVRVADSGTSREMGRREHRVSRGHGSGRVLGLSLAADLVQGMGGSLDFERLAHGGSAYTVSLSAARVAQETMA